ncbi:MAG: sulfatase-like hydrolase/transferase, partial [Bacteroidetes bacterium]|nr:sulfatase-like hydrolase/transferase [Bacteroidota bacterium]
THANYKYRYPKSFDVFSTDDASQKQLTIDQYDNAVLYNDYIVREIIEKARITDIPSSVIYFSDHGEEVYDSIDFAGHSANGYFTYNLIEIPFLYWNSMNNEISKQFLQRPFILNDLSHTLANLYRIDTKQIDSTKSIFSKAFKSRQRIVRDTIIVN